MGPVQIRDIPPRYYVKCPLRYVQWKQWVMSNAPRNALCQIAHCALCLGAWAYCALRWFTLGPVSQAMLVDYALCQTPERPYAARSHAIDSKVAGTRNILRVAHHGRYRIAFISSYRLQHRVTPKRGLPRIALQNLQQVQQRAMRYVYNLMITNDTLQQTQAK